MASADLRVLATAVFVFVFPGRYGVLGGKQLDQKIAERKIYAQTNFELQRKTSGLAV